MTNPKLLLNRWKSNDGTVLISRFQNMCLYDTDEDHMELRELYPWTSYGIDGQQPPKTQVIKDLTTDHIENILKTQIHLQEHVLSMFRRELTYRALLS